MSIVKIAIMTQAPTPDPATDQAVDVVSTPEVLGLVESSTNTLPTVTSTGSTSVAAAESSSTLEHEEGEIETDEDERGVLEYEDISSEEEFSIRERIAQLEAMDSKLGQLTRRNKRLHAKDRPLTTLKDGKENYECISDEEDVELYLNRYEPFPKPKLLPARRTLRTSHTGSQSMRSSTKRHSTTERSRRKIEKRKRAQSTLRKASLHRRHKRRKHPASSSVVSIKDSSDSEVDFPLDRARLQAACNISSRKRKTDKENWDALKQKLQLSMQRRKKDESNINYVEIIQDEPVVLDDDDDDNEEDDEVLQLRLQALKTKAEVKDAGFISLAENPLPPTKMAEEQELRLLALQSAFTKKHQIRLKKRQADRPYSPSDDIPLLLSPTGEYPVLAQEITNIDDDIQIIETQPETVEIIDSSSENENQMEICRTESPESPKSPEAEPVDEELIESVKSPSPPPPVTSDQDVSMEAVMPEPPPPPVIGNLQRTHSEEEDEDTLRNQLLSTLSASALKSNNNFPDSRPMTPDSMAEEEAEALRELILSKMHKKVTEKRRENTNIPPTSEVSSQPDTINIPQDLSNVALSLKEHRTADVNGTSPVGPISSPALAANSTCTNQLRQPANPNLITLIGKQKITRKKRKKSLTSIQSRAAKKALAASPMAIAVPPPARTLIKAPKVQTPSPISLTVPLVSTTKLVNNPNKLINLNAPLPSNSSKERSATVETFIQKPVRKLIIQVGNSDSDSDSDYYPAPDEEPAPKEIERLRESFLRDLDNASPSRVMLESPTYSPVPTESTEHDDEPLVAAVPEATAITTGDHSGNQVAFEQRLDQFLKTVRSKIDQNQKDCAGENETVKRTNVAPSAGGGSNGLGTVVTAPKKVATTPAPVTPLAVRHLPKSAQLEYKRLVARMAQLERQKQLRMVVVNNERVASKRPPPLTKTIINTGPSDDGATKNLELVVTVNRDKRNVLDTSNTGMPRNNLAPLKRDSDTLFKRVLINNTVIAESKSNPPLDTAQVQQQTLEDTKDDSSETNADLPHTGAKENEQCNLAPVSPNRKIGTAQTDQEISTLREALRRLSSIKEGDRMRVLSIAEYRSEKHSQRFHKELRDLIATVENAKQERQKQYDLENKVAFLKEKLAVLERGLALHKGRIAQIFPALQQSHSKVMHSRKKSMELNSLCLEIGRMVKGQSYSTPSTIHNEIHEQLKILTTETKRLKNMKKLSLEEFKQITADQRQFQVSQRQKLAVEENPSTVSPETIATTVRPSAAVPIIVKEEQLHEQQLQEEETEAKQHYKSASSSGSASPSIVEANNAHISMQEELTGETRARFGTYSSPLVSFKDQSALNIPDGVICPYQMSGECVDQDCKFEHFR
ncbi:uncharacterized protein LOC131694057 isoform X1 [Topomyia yanbarensis]|uniref:uncharacterized protein LOC131694057 isoform X1 n=1 Tax=Topomyia yanbarensis TaxID=2498891 RepID=UPI00273C84D8|nr:uncharacterized protein LOC131694057 isoform X1 [Topomyia yanbarensis]